MYVKLKWGLEYKGFLLSSDAYMNLQLEQCEEFIDGKSQGNLGEVLIRCALALSPLPPAAWARVSSAVGRLARRARAARSCWHEHISSGCKGAYIRLANSAGVIRRLPACDVQV